MVLRCKTPLILEHLPAYKHQLCILLVPQRSIYWLLFYVLATSKVISERHNVGIKKPTFRVACDQVDEWVRAMASHSEGWEFENPDESNQYVYLSLPILALNITRIGTGLFRTRDN